MLHKAGGFGDGGFVSDYFFTILTQSVHYPHPEEKDGVDHETAGDDHCLIQVQFKLLILVSEAMSDQVSQVSRSQTDINKLNNDGY